MIYYVAFNALVSIFFVMIWNSKDWVNFLIRMVLAAWCFANVVVLFSIVQPLVAASGMKLF